MPCGSGSRAAGRQRQVQLFAFTQTCKLVHTQRQTCFKRKWNTHVRYNLHLIGTVYSKNSVHICDWICKNPRFCILHQNWDFAIFSFWVIPDEVNVTFAQPSSDFNKTCTDILRMKLCVSMWNLRPLCCEASHYSPSKCAKFTVPMCIKIPITLSRITYVS